MREINVEELLDDICKKYNLGKTPLALSLGWGEKNIYRYYKGFNPSKKRIELLVDIYNNPLIFLECLEKNKNSLSHVAYRKTREAVEKAIENISTGDDKIDWILEYFMINNEDLSANGIKVILFYVEGFARFLIKKEFKSLDLYMSKDGITYPELENLIKVKNEKGCKNIVKKRIELDSSKVDRFEFMLLETLSRYMCCYSNAFLVELLESNKRLREIKDSINGDEIVRIDSKEIEKIFEELIDEYEIKSLDDIPKYIENFHRKYVNR